MTNDELDAALLEALDPKWRRPVADLACIAGLSSREGGYDGPRISKALQRLRKAGKAQMFRGGSGMGGSCWTWSTPVEVVDGTAKQD